MFSIEVPLSPSDAASAPAHRPGDGADASTPMAPRSESILIIEDDPEVREHLELFLNDEGYRTSTVVNGPAALDAMSSNLFKETIASGTAELGNPASIGFGTIRQGYLEFSNVSLTGELAHLTHAQRAYEAILQAMQTAKQMAP